MKSEFLQHWYDKNGIPLRSRIIAYLPSINSLGAIVPGIYNFFISNRFISGVIKNLTGFAAERSIPGLYRTTLRKWIKKNRESLKPEAPQGKICLFIDEFTNFNDTEIGIKTIKLLAALNYEVITVDHEPSARTYLSKGLVRKAGKVIKKNIRIFSPIINENLPLIGIEPSAILGFRDEYPDLCGQELRDESLELSKHCYLLDEFLVMEYKKGRIKNDDFNKPPFELMVHTHCQQKAIASSSSLLEALKMTDPASVREIPSGCCGMAGSFGYEKEHFELSNKIGELVLFPEIRNSGNGTKIIAPGTSCRHHIKDGTGRIALHPAEFLYEAVRK